MASQRQADTELGDSIASDLVDLCDIPLADIDTSQDTALAHVVAQLLDDLGTRREAIAGFNSVI